MNINQLPVQLPSSFPKLEQQFFLDFKCSINVRKLKNYERANPSSWPLLYQIALQVNALSVENLEWIWAKGVSPLSKINGESILHFTLSRREKYFLEELKEEVCLYLGINLKILQAIIEQRVDPLWSNGKGDTAFHIYLKSTPSFFYFKNIEEKNKSKNFLKGFFEIIGHKSLFKKNSKGVTPFSMILESQNWFFLEAIMDFYPSSVVFSRLKEEDLRKIGAPEYLQSKCSEINLDHELSHDLATLLKISKKTRL